ncbi:MAG: hypothetical protein V2A71_06615, partial [Candidatus Eisenbacteria bacterium]
MRPRNLATFLMLALVFAFALSLPAQAQQTIGGHDETSEVNNPRWANGAPTPGVAPALTAVHLLVSEFAVTLTQVEFIEIYNPTAEPVALGNYYLSDAWYEPAGLPIEGYFRLPEAGYLITTNTDFNVRFPAGAVIQPGQVIVIALYGPGIDSTYGVGTADYEVSSVDPNIPDMINVGNNQVTAGTTTLTNSSEFAMLFYWDGVSDL